MRIPCSAHQGQCPEMELHRKRDTPGRGRTSETIAFVEDLRKEDRFEFTFRGTRILGCVAAHEMCAPRSITFEFMDPEGLAARKGKVKKKSRYKGREVGWHWDELYYEDDGEWGIFRSQRPLLVAKATPDAVRLKKKFERWILSGCPDDMRLEERDKLWDCGGRLCTWLGRSSSGGVQTEPKEEEVVLRRRNGTSETVSDPVGHEGAKTPADGHAGRGGAPALTKRCGLEGQHPADGLDGRETNMLAARVESEDMIDDEELGRQAYALIGELILETAEAEMGKMARAMKRRRHAKTVSRWVEVHRHRVDWTTRQILNETVRGIVRSVALEAQTELSWREDRAREKRSRHWCLVVVIGEVVEDELRTVVAEDLSRRRLRSEKIRLGMDVFWAWYRAWSRSGVAETPKLGRWRDDGRRTKDLRRDDGRRTKDLRRAKGLGGLEREHDGGMSPTRWLGGSADGCGSATPGGDGSGARKAIAAATQSTMLGDVGLASWGGWRIEDVGTGIELGCVCESRFDGARWRGGRGFLYWRRLRDSGRALRERG